MAVPSSGLLCLKGFGLEKICNSYTSLCSIGTVGMKGVTVGGQFGSTCTFPATNTSSPSFLVVVLLTVFQVGMDMIMML